MVIMIQRLIKFHLLSSGSDSLNKVWLNVQTLDKKLKRGWKRFVRSIGHFDD